MCFLVRNSILPQSICGLLAVYLQVCSQLLMIIIYQLLIGYRFTISIIFLCHFSELANAGRPLFPGNDVDDQLKRIFRYPLNSGFRTTLVCSDGTCQISLMTCYVVGNSN